MNINHLAIFYAVAEEGNLTRAAERMHISQPAVSKQLRELERSVGMALFHRLSKGVRLTEAGELLFGYSRQIFALQEEAQNALQELRVLERGSLRVGASTTVGTYLLPEICARFRQQYPRVEMQLEIDNTRAIQQHLLRGDIDLALTEGVDESSDFSCEAFYNDEIVPIAPPHHPLTCPRNLSLEELSRYPMILREGGSGTREVIEQAHRERGLEVQVLMTLGNPEAIKRAVAAGIGLAWMSRLAIENEVRDGRFKVLCGDELTLPRPLHRLRIAGRYEGRAAREFFRLLRQSVDEVAETEKEVRAEAQS
jgi:DNA-binding transcriptional LysR family regulator